MFGTMVFGKFLSDFVREKSKVSHRLSTSTSWTPISVDKGVHVYIQTGIL